MSSNYFDFQDADPQQSGFDLIPKGAVVPVRMTIKPGGYDDPEQGWGGGYATESFETGSIYLAAEFVVTAGDHAKRKMWSNIGLHSKKGPTWGQMGRSFIRAALNSARNVHPQDNSPQAAATRRIQGFHELDGLEFLARVDQADPLRQQQRVWQQAAAGPGAGPLNRMLAFDWRYTLAEADLPKVRGSTALAGVGVGFPFLDAALADFSLRLPDDYKLKGLKLRWFFKEALRGFLPDEILAKKKQGFGLPFGVWANRHAGLKAFAADSLHSLAGRGIVRREFLRSLLDEHLPAHPGYYGEMVWILTMLEQWLQCRRQDF